MAAVDSGADAVYFGGEKFSARRNAVNISDSELEKAVTYAHLRGVKLYAAVNTLMFDAELNGVFEFLKFLYESGVDGVIVQDLGVLSIARQYFPDFRVHASTQMTVHNLAGALEAEKLGFSRVVLSRELSLEEIKYISENSDIELEVFVHGALCMSYSGQCLFSSFLGGRSGNRGFCAQPCRLNYTLTDGSGTEISQKNKYLLSLKDLSLIDYINELREAGVKSFKIEGRMKSAAYVSAVTGIFSKYRDGSKVSGDDRRLLEDIFSRNGFTDGYFKANTGRHMLNYSQSNDDIYFSATDEVIAAAREFAGCKHRCALNAEFKACAGKKASFTAEYDGIIFSCESDDVVQKAQNKPSDSERIRQQLEKLGGTLFYYSSLTINCGNDIFIPVREINNMRRSIVESIEKHILGSNPKYAGDDFRLIKTDKPLSKSRIHTASVRTAQQAQTAYNLGFDKIYLPYALYLENKELYDNDADVYSVMLPPINHDRHNWDFSDVSTESVCITNIGQLAMLSGRHDIVADYRMNITNSLSMKTLAKLGVKRMCLSSEMTLTQLRDITSSFPTEIVVYGRIALMTVKNCVIKSAMGKCGCVPGEIYYIRDRKNISFPVFPDKSTCTNVIYNSAPVYMADRMNELDSCNIGSYRFDFTDESVTEMAEIMKKYEKGLKSDGFFTRGHFYNGIS